MHRLGIRYWVGLPDIGREALVFLWKDSTYVEGLQEHGETKWIVINRACLDISKERVDAVHQMVFGYSLRVDPVMHVGPMVEKSNLNGAHDGRVIVGPVQAVNPESVYQKIVVNLPPKGFDTGVASSELICDLRLPVFSGHIPFGYLKARPRERRFENRNTVVRLAETSAILSPTEVERIVEFCRLFGVDYGEIDVVRDSTDGLIYVLDVNKTPHGPPNGLTAAESERALAMYEITFSDWLQRLTAVARR